MDDVVFALLVAAEALLEAVAKALSIIDTTFRKYGFEVNYGVGKTEAVVVRRGNGQNDIRSRLPRTEDGAWHLPTGRGQRLRLVRAHKHTGTPPPRT